MNSNELEMNVQVCVCVYQKMSGSLCHSLRGKHGVGRIDIVENRFIGMKSRGKELKIVFLIVCLGYDISSNLCQISLTSFLIYTINDMHYKCS